VKLQGVTGSASLIVFQVQINTRINLFDFPRIKTDQEVFGF